MRQVLLQMVPFFPFLFGLIQWIGTVIEHRKGIVKSNVLERTTEGLFLVSISVLILLLVPWAAVGNRPRYAIYAGVAVLVVHTVVAAAAACAVSSRGVSYGVGSGATPLSGAVLIRLYASLQLAGRT